MGWHKYSKKRISFFLILYLFSIIFVGCGGNKQTPINDTEIPSPTPTLIPTSAPDRAVLIAPIYIPESDIAEAEVVLSELSINSGLEFEVRQEIFANEISPDIKVIIFLELPENFGSLAASAPATQFVAISEQNWSPPANGTIIRKNKDHAIFLAGYLSALLAPNFRVGALQTLENVQSNQAFNNGVSYYCGLCAALVYPLNTYPVISQQPANSPAANWQAAFNEINFSKVNVLYLPAEAVSDELSIYLAGMDVAVIGTYSPPEELRSRWVATINADGLTPLKEIWGELVAGQGGRILNASIKVTDVNFVELSDGLVWLSQGKMQLLNTIIELLREDQIYTYSVIQ